MTSSSVSSRRWSRRVNCALAPHRASTSLLNDADDDELGGDHFSRSTRHIKSPSFPTDNEYL